MRCLHLIISGHVQGVCFRAYAVEEARRLGLTGWVKNRADGRVEALTEGPPDKLKEFEAWCYTGSPASEVTDVKSQWSEATGQFTGFTLAR